MAMEYKDMEVRVSGVRLSPTKTRVSCGGFDLLIDKLGGDAPSPLDLALASLVGCINITATLVAKEMAIEVSEASFEAMGIFNPAVLYGKEGPRAGYKEVKVIMRLKTDADEEKLREFIRRVEERCPVSDNLSNTTPLRLVVERA